MMYYYNHHVQENTIAVQTELIAIIAMMLYEGAYADLWCSRALYGALWCSMVLWDALRYSRVLYGAL